MVSEDPVVNLLVQFKSFELITKKIIARENFVESCKLQMFCSNEHVYCTLEYANTQSSPGLIELLLRVG